MKELEVAVVASCLGYRLRRRSGFAGSGSIVLTTLLAGIEYEVEVSLWDVDRAAVDGPEGCHVIRFGGRSYTSDDGVKLPSSVMSAFRDAIAGVQAWMVVDGVTRSTVERWGVEQAERKEVIRKRRMGIARRLLAKHRKAREEKKSPPFIDPVDQDRLGLERIAGETIREAVQRFELGVGTVES